MTMRPFTLSTIRADSAVVCVSLAGDLDLLSVTVLQEALNAAETLAPAELILDLTALTFLDSTGLHCIVRAHDRAKQAGRRLFLVPGSAHIQWVLELTGMDKHLEFVTPAIPD